MYVLVNLVIHVYMHITITMFSKRLIGMTTKVEGRSKRSKLYYIQKHDMKSCMYRTNFRIYRDVFFL